MTIRHTFAQAEDEARAWLETEENAVSVQLHLDHNVGQAVAEELLKDLMAAVHVTLLSKGWVTP